MSPKLLAGLTIASARHARMSPVEQSTPGTPAKHSAQAEAIWVSMSRSRSFILDLEVEPFARHPPVLGLVKAVEAGGAMGDVLFDLVRLDEHAHRQDLLAEVPLVERAVEHGLVQPLKLREREARRQQLEADRLVADLAPQPAHRRVEHAGVVERERRAVADGEPLGIGGVRG